MLNANKEAFSAHLDTLERHFLQSAKLFMCKNNYLFLIYLSAIFYLKLHSNQCPILSFIIIWIETGINFKILISGEKKMEKLCFNLFYFLFSRDRILQATPRPKRVCFSAFDLPNAVLGAFSWLTGALNYVNTIERQDIGKETNV